MPAALTAIPQGASWGQGTAFSLRVEPTGTLGANSLLHPLSGPVDSSNPVFLPKSTKTKTCAHLSLPQQLFSYTALSSRTFKTCVSGSGGERNYQKRGERVCGGRERRCPRCPRRRLTGRRAFMTLHAQREVPEGRPGVRAPRLAASDFFLLLNSFKVPSPTLPARNSIQR